MFYERKLSSFPELLRCLRVLDQDAGIRVSGEVGGKKALLFVTRFGARYTLMSYSVSGGGPGKRLQALEFDSPDAAGEALKKVVPGRLRACVY